MNQAVEDSVGDGGVADVLVPVFDRKLAGHECGAGAVAVFDDFQEIPSFWVSQGGEAKVVKDEELGFEEFFHGFGIAPIGFGKSEVIE